MEMMKLTEKDIRIIGELAGDPERLDKQDYKNVTVLALVAEIERQREEIAALQAALTKTRKEAMSIIRENRTTEAFPHADAIVTLVDTALNAPAPEIKVVGTFTEGKRVAIRETGERGVIRQILYTGFYRVEFTNGELDDFHGYELSLI